MEQTPPRQELGARSSAREQNVGETIVAQLDERAPAHLIGMEEALQRAAGVLEEAQGCLAAILSVAPAGMEAIVCARVQAFADAMSALCMGMAL